VDQRRVAEHGPAHGSPDTSDWIGNWEKPLGGIEIRAGGIGDRLQIEGVALLPMAHGFNV